ncbi:hypothetical protein C823_002814 [Eubacterium plexicaudatum ASF492]|nr:hypothetical protein C823_002814 [Eubacterium plexicaudatum ASF492]
MIGIMKQSHFFGMIAFCSVQGSYGKVFHIGVCVQISIHINAVIK